MSFVVKYFYNKNIINNYSVLCNNFLVAHKGVKV